MLTVPDCDLLGRVPTHYREGISMDTALVVAQLALAISAMVTITRALVLQIERN